MLKITELKIALSAAEAALNEAIKADPGLNSAESRAIEAAYDAAVSAEADEFYKARDLKKKFEERGDTTTGAGECNARDTHGGHADSEYSTEFWQCAIDSVQLMLDCEPSTVLEKDVK